MRLIKGLIAAAIAASLLVLPAGALAQGRDRDRDRMPDKWEKKHGLNPRVKDARKDPDHDGLSNLSEFRHGTDPQRADTDDDNVSDGHEVREGSDPRDGDEISGTVVSFEAGVLTIQLPGQGAGTAAGTVTGATEIECDDDDAPAAGASREGDSGEGSDDADHSGGDDPSGDANRSGDDDRGDDDRCTTAGLAPGARVHEGELATASDGTDVFTKIELVPAA